MPATEFRNKEGGTQSSAFSLAITCRCPHCWIGRLYRGLLKIAPVCSHCAYPLEEIDAGDGAAPFVMLVVGVIFTPLAVWVALSFSFPLWGHILLWPPLITGLAILLMRPTKAWLIAHEYRRRKCQEWPCS